MFLFSKWLDLPLATKVVLANQFGFSKVGPTHVADNRVVSDGYNVQDVERSLNFDAIQAYTGSKSKDMEVLWDLMIAKAEGKLEEKFPMQTVEAVEIKPEEVVPGDVIETPKKKAVKKAKTK